MSSKKLKQLVLQNKMAVGVLLLTTLIAIYFAGKLFFDLIYFKLPEHRDQSLKHWMTPRYVMMSYDLPQPLVNEIFQLDPASTKHRKMRFIAEDLDLSLEELTELVRRSAKEYRDTSE